MGATFLGETNRCPIPARVFARDLLRVWQRRRSYDRVCSFGWSEMPSQSITTTSPGQSNMPIPEAPTANGQPPVQAIEALQKARAGSAESLGQLLDNYCRYLTLLA